MPKKQEEEKFYLGNKNLPRPDQEFEWTPKMVRDLKKCRQNKENRRRFIKENTIFGYKK